MNHANQNRPLARFRAGAVHAAVWENHIHNHGTPAIMLKASVERRFKDTNGQWRSSTGFSRSELPLAMHCLKQAFAFMIEHDNTRAAEGGPERADVRPP